MEAIAVTQDKRPELVLVRHGETAWSKSGQHTGRTDIELTELGERQAIHLGDMLARRSYAAVYTSPMQRAQDTCRLAGYGRYAEVDVDLLEWNYGIYEARTTPEIRETIPGWSVWTHPIIDGEAVEAVGNRCDRVIERVRAIDGNVMLFAHAHLLRILTARWLGLPAGCGRLFTMGTAAVSILGYERESPALAMWNETCHLQGMEAPR
jgi:broad specificity phosphatase PhoE